MPEVTDALSLSCVYESEDLLDVFIAELDPQYIIFEMEVDCERYRIGLDSTQIHELVTHLTKLRQNLVETVEAVATED